MSNPTPQRWQALCATDDVAVGMPRRVQIEDLPPLAVFNLDGAFFVTADTCTHGAASLSDGYLEGDEVECPWHSGKFCVRDGRPTAFPAVEPLKVYPVRVQDGQVCIDRTAEEQSED